MSTAYLEILQLRNDVGDLKSLGKALALAEAKLNMSTGILDLESNVLSQAIAEQMAT
jgi:hypothetical protein